MTGRPGRLDARAVGLTAVPNPHPGYERARECATSSVREHDRPPRRANDHERAVELARAWGCVTEVAENATDVTHPPPERPRTPMTSGRAQALARVREPDLTGSNASRRPGDKAPHPGGG